MIAHFLTWLAAALLAWTGALPAHAAAPCVPSTPPAVFAPQAANLPSLQTDRKVGDLVFINVKALPFQKVSNATCSWTNHVGIVVEVGGAEPIVAESKFPLSTRTPLSRFLARSKGGQYAVLRPAQTFTAEQETAIVQAATKRMGIWYDTGFDLHSRREFCSRFVREVLQEAVQLEVGEVENFATLLRRNPAGDVGFWRAWYFGNIPWQRETVTPASVLADARLRVVR